MLFDGKYKVLTKVFDNSIIESEIIDYAKNISRTIIDTQEQQVRESLILLGWTPPKQGDDNMNTFHRHIEAQEQRSYLLRIEEENKKCPNCETDMEATLSEKGRFMLFHCRTCANKRRIEL